MSEKKKCIVWLRKDLRIHDHPGFKAAVEQGYEILPLFIWDAQDHRWAEGEASQWWLYYALTDLAEQLAELGGELHICRAKGNSAEVLETIAKAYNADTIFWGRRYEPEIIERDKDIKQGLKADGYEVKSYNTHLLFEPHTIKNKSGSHFKVFTPYWKHCREHAVDPVSVTDWKPCKFIAVNGDSLSIDKLNLLPQIEWDKGFHETWNPTRKGAEDRLELMKQGKAKIYQGKRDTPAADGTSKLSPWLQWGQLSAREIYHALANSSDEIIHTGYLRQLFWREFSYHLLYHAPHSTDRPLRPEYEEFCWKPNQAYLKAWQEGNTGYPIIDAGMRQLWRTGWMHNRVRMVVSSFLVKHLLQDWREGASWFWDTLVDSDLANNTMGWQWIAGSGADASPYFRIFNPITQGEKFDKEGDYVREFCPELADVPNRYIHKPWDMPELELAVAGVTLGKDYPFPIISHPDGRQQALEAFATFQETRKK